MNSKLKHLFIGLIASLFFSQPLQAQQVHSLTLEQSIDMAIKNVQDLKNLKLDIALQQTKNREIEGSAYPQVTANITMQRLFAIPVTVIPDFISPAVYGVLTNEGVRDGNGNPIQMPEKFGNVPAQFGVPWTASAGFTLQQLLFQADVFIGLKARKTAMEYAEANYKVGEDKVRENVMNAYYAVLIAQKQLNFLTESESRLLKLVQDMTQMYKNGFAEKLDIDKAQVGLNNLMNAKAQLSSMLDGGYANFKFQLGIPQTDSVILISELSTQDVKNGILDEANFQYAQRNEIQALEKVRKLLEMDVQRYKLNKLPTLAAFWNFSENAQRQQFDFFKRGAQYPWFQTSIVGLQVNMPIFSGFSKNQKIKEASYNLQKHQNTIKNVEQSIDLQKTVARKTLVNNLKIMDASEKNMQLAQNVYNTTKKKYEQGLGSSFEVLTADTDLQNAQSNYFTALYNALIAKVNYMKALGKLSEKSSN
jgi:outer membrane protein TolC